MLFQPVLTKVFKSELFSCLPKVDHVIKSSKDQPINWTVRKTTMPLKHANFNLIKRGVKGEIIQFIFLNQSNI